MTTQYTPEQFAKYFTQRQMQRAHGMCVLAVGKKIRVALDKKTTQIGVITSAKPSYVTAAGRGYKMVFSVDVECGELKVLRNFKLDRLPT